ncbi:MAG: hypothetical protein HZB16_24880 [Armatimonadetes bacterium]|nr:hypothetical protein [Armatimonadota bacterium]
MAVLPAIESLLDPLLTGTPVPDDQVQAWAPSGLSRFDVATRLVRGWLSQAPPEEVAEHYLPALIEHAASAPDPDAALLCFSRLQADQGGLSLIAQMTADPRLGHDLLFLLGLGPLAAEALIGEPGLTDLLLEPELLAQPADPQRVRGEALALVRRLRVPENRRNALRRWKRGQVLRILARDWLLRAPQKVITAEISALADACCEAALAAACADVLGLPPEPTQGLCVIAMGKWGSRELNYNSDIDLLCVCDGRHGLSHDAWEHVVREMSRELDEPTAEGRVFAVDHRLRPDGIGGTLVRTMESCCTYYQEHSAAWEALALTRARAAAGDMDLGRAFEQLAQQIAFGARLRHAGIESIRANRRTLDARSAAHRNVKEGPGGIRDIEFTTQLLQLVLGVTDPTVRERNTWDALLALQRAGAISYTERGAMGETYDFLRRVEHLLQIQPAAPTKDLPEDRAGLRRLARAMGYRDSGPLTAGDRFLGEFHSHTSRTRELCNRIFFNPIPLSSPDAESHISQLLDPMADDTEALRHLEGIAFASPAEARRRLLFLAHGEPPMRLPEDVQALFVQFLPALLGCVQRMPDPDAALRSFERMVSRAGGRELAYQFFLDHPTVLEVMCRIGGYSEYLSQILVDHPEFLDRMVLASYAQRDPTLDDLVAEIGERIAPLRKPESRLDDLRRFRRREAFRIGVRDLLGVIDTEQTIGCLADLAEACLRVLSDEIQASLPGADALKVAIIGLGKLGGRELHYSSDLDVLFVYEPVGLDDEMALVQRWASQVTRAADEFTRAGRLYPLDSRLRPFGANGPLVRTLESYQNYWRQHAEPWERLALTRCRPVAGDAEVGRRFAELAEGFVYGEPPDEAAMESLRGIKRRIETERLDTADTSQLDLKLEPGGIMDIEYLTQVLQIQGGTAHPSVRGGNTPLAIAALGRAGLLTEGEADLLSRNYWHLRRTELRLQLIWEQPSGNLPLDPEHLAAAAVRLGWSVREAAAHPERLPEDVRLRLRAVREVVVRRLGI